ncbi:MAG: HlyD family efflux transporter periplasmic adaptor subunit [Acidimicrobiales bacterium]
MAIRTFRRWSRKRVITIVLGLAVALVAALALNSIYNPSTPASSAPGPIVPVTQGDVVSSVTSSGNLATVSTAEENFDAGGTLASLNVKVGSNVKAGEVLATIDPSAASATLDQAETSLRVDEMTSAMGTTSVTSAKKNLASARATLARDEAGGTAVNKLQTQAALESAEQQLANDQQQLTTDQATLTDDENTLASAESSLTADEQLGCPAPNSGSGSSGQSSDIANPALGAAPSVATGSASSIGAASVDLNATINPNGAATTYYFEYGTTSAYGLLTSTFSLASGTSSSPVSVDVTGLSADTTYLYRVVATNSVGSSIGSGVTFTTAQSSCSLEQQSAATDQATVTTDEDLITKDEAAITSQQLSVEIAQDNAKASPTTLGTDRASITQDENAVRQAEITVAQDAGTLAQDQATIDSDQRTLNETRLTALISGTVTDLDASVGQIVSGGGSTLSDGASSGSSTPLITIEGLKSLEVVASFAEADAVNIKVGQKVAITLASLPGTEVTGVVSAIAPISTVVNNVVTYPVTIIIAHPPSSVRDGMTAETAVIVKEATNVLELPNAAITTLGNHSFVDVVTAKGKKRLTPIETGLVGGSYTEITSGLHAGQLVQEPSVSTTGATTGNTNNGGPKGGFVRVGIGGGP